MTAAAIGKRQRNQWAEDMRRLVLSNGGWGVYTSGHHTVFAFEMGDEVHVYDCRVIRTHEEPIRRD